MVEIMKTRTLGAMTLVSIAGLAMAHTGATGIVKERMDGMGRVAAAAKQINGALEQDPVDREIVSAAARIIASEGGHVMLDRFPEGSMPEVSEARPEIWTNWPRFEALARATTQRADRLAQLASAPNTSREEFDQAFSDLRQICSDCHAEFRIKK